MASHFQNITLNGVFKLKMIPYNVILNNMSNMFATWYPAKVRCKMKKHPF